MKLSLFGIFSYIVLITAFILMLIVFWMLFRPFREIDFIPSTIPILNQNKIVHYNEPVLSKLTFCVYEAVPTTSLRVFHEQGGNDQAFYLNPVTNTPQLGCRTVTPSNYRVPNDLPPGKYILDLNLSYKVNVLRTESQTISTEEFTIEK